LRLFHRVTVLVTAMLFVPTLVGCVRSEMEGVRRSNLARHIAIPLAAMS
jgi:hypothetical protein